MSFFKVETGDVESFTVVTNPSRHFVTSSAGATGSVYVFARRSSIEKEPEPLSSFIDATANDTDLTTTLRSVQNMGRNAMIVDGVGIAGLLATSDFVVSSTIAFNGMLDDYMS